MRVNILGLFILFIGLAPSKSLWAQTLKDKIFVSYSLFPSTDFKKNSGRKRGRQHPRITSRSTSHSTQSTTKMDQQLQWPN